MYWPTLSGGLVRYPEKNFTVKKYLILLNAFLGLSLWLVPTLLCAREPQIKIEQVLQTTQSWDGSQYTSYPTGQPQVTVLRITIPPNTTLPWHHHPMINVGYVLSGHHSACRRSVGRNCRHDASRVHDKWTSRANRVLRRTSRVTA